MGTSLRHDCAVIKALLRAFVDDSPAQNSSAELEALVTRLKAIHSAPLTAALSDNIAPMTSSATPPPSVFFHDLPPANEKLLIVRERHIALIAAHLISIGGQLTKVLTDSSRGIPGPLYQY